MNLNLNLNSNFVFCYYMYYYFVIVPYSLCILQPFSQGIPNVNKHQYQYENHFLCVTVWCIILFCVRVMFFKYLFKRGYFLLLKGFQATNVLIIYARQRKAKTHTHTVNRNWRGMKQLNGGKSNQMKLKFNFEFNSVMFYDN